jgi:hypothetical protein
VQDARRWLVDIGGAEGVLEEGDREGLVRIA